MLQSGALSDGEARSSDPRRVGTFWLVLDVTVSEKLTVLGRPQLLDTLAALSVKLDMGKVLKAVERYIPLPVVRSIAANQMLRFVEFRRITPV